MESFSEHILFKNTGGTALITLNRSQAMNAFSDDFLDEIDNVITHAEHDDSVKVIVITGTENAFTTGGDLNDINSMSKDHMQAAKLIDKAADTVMHLYKVKKPVITAVNGAVYGAGIALMMAGDIIVSSERAKIGYSFPRIGLCPDSGATWLLCKKVGYNKAAEILFLGETLTAEEALKLGIVNRIVSHESLIEEAMTIAQQLSDSALMALMLTKRVLRNAINASFEENREMEVITQMFASRTDDFKEGISALLEKRSPVFKGK